jgi:RNA polymerase sigma factor (sigma-70 family)
MDQTALDAFCHREHRRLVGMLGLYCGDGDLAEDLAQEALARLVRQWPKLPSEADASRWLTRVALNLAKSSFRSRTTRRRILERYGASLVPGSVADHRVETALAVRAAVAQLPDRQRRVVILRYFCDLPVADVAALLGCPKGTVKSLTSLAVQRLRRAGLEFTDD